MPAETIYLPKYQNSWALVIGINAYRRAPPLGYARRDAEAFSGLLSTRFGFSPDNVTVLLDEDASRDTILSSFLRFSRDDIAADDRVLVFFAGHGHTRTGRRGEVGYLVPADGDPNELSTLIRWDDLTRNADLVPAKHLLFIMDACYGGLAITRALSPGSARFLKDMLQRYSRQVLTAGKADEVVADSGGPRPGHSIFTGHLLDALEGCAAAADGVISANAVMAYVYERVSKDAYSHQTPHFGFLDGDGDLIIQAPTLKSLSSDQGIDTDLLIQIPSTTPAEATSASESSLADLVKDYLSDSRYRIRLDDLVTTEIRSTLHAIREEAFPIQGITEGKAEFAERLRKYEHALSRLMTVAILIGRWGQPEHQPALEKIVARLAEQNSARGGSVLWIELRWYPLLLLMYASGIAALSSENYRSLSTTLTTRIGTSVSGRSASEAIVATIRGILDVDRTNYFKTLPGHERNYVPRSEYLFKALQPVLDDALFLGHSYEDLFDRFEILFALIFADITRGENEDVWGPPGRFGWKRRHGLRQDPYASLVQDVTRAGAKWSALETGLFRGSLDRFKQTASAYHDQILSKLTWF